MGFYKYRMAIMKTPVKVRKWIGRLGIRAIALFWVIWVRAGSLVGDRILINHEEIHIRQQAELLWVGFVVIYFAQILHFFFRHLFQVKYTGFWSWIAECWWSAYRRSMFEREATRHQYDMHYLETRKRYAWIRYMFASQYA